MSEAIERLDCHAAMRQLWDYLDAELDEARMAAVRMHLATCGACYGHYDFARHFLGALETSLAAECAPPALHARVLGALRAEGFVAEYGER